MSITKFLLYFMTMCIIVVLCFGFSHTAYAGIGAEPSNKAAESMYTDPQAMTGVPPYPGTSSDMSGAMIPVSQPMQMYPDIPSYLFAGPVPGATYPSYGTVPGMPYPSAYGDMSGYYYPPASGTMSGYPPVYGTTPYPPVSGDMSGYPPVYGTTPYPPVSGDMSGYPPVYGTMPGYPSMYGDMSGSMYPGGMYPGGMYPVPSAPTGDASQQYPLPYPTYPYDPMQQQPYPGPYQNPWNPYSYPQQYEYASADQVYNQAMQAYRNGDSWTALSKFQEVAMRYPQSDLVDNAHYWTGEIYYTWKNFPMAIQSYQTVLRSYPQGNKVPDAHLKLGYAYAELRQYPTAKTILNDVLTRYADNKRIRELALKKLNELNNIY